MFDIILLPFILVTFGAYISNNKDFIKHLKINGTRLLHPFGRYHLRGFSNPLDRYSKVVTYLFV